MCRRKFNALTAVFRAHGYRLREIKSAGLVSTVLGVEVEIGWARTKTSKVLLLRAALLAVWLFRVRDAQVIPCLAASLCHLAAEGGLHLL